MRGPPLISRRPWMGRRIVLGVCGGIAAYKSVQLARDLTQLGAEVDTVLTSGAERFIAGLSFEGVTGRPAFTDLFSADGAARHIRLGGEADVVVVAPATANFIARVAQGRADDLLTTTLLATRTPVLICPAMNDRMFGHPGTRENLEHLRQSMGYTVIGPDSGPLAFGEGEGPGRMVEPAEITEHIGLSLTVDSSLQGKKVLVTSGPTREALDPVRYLSNRSSGRMGRAIGQAAWRRGAEVTVISGPVELPPPTGVEMIRVESAEEMRAAVVSTLPEMDVVFFASAVADFRPSQPESRKLKRDRAAGAFTIELTPTPDIAGETIVDRRPDVITVGFALETDDLLVNAEVKLEKKKFDLIVANPAGETDAGFEAETNRVIIIGRGREPREHPVLPKDEVAELLLDEVESLCAARARLQSG